MIPLVANALLIICESLSVLAFLGNIDPPRRIDTNYGGSWSTSDIDDTKYPILPSKLYSELYNTAKVSYLTHAFRGTGCLVLKQKSPKANALIIVI